MKKGFNFILISKHTPYGFSQKYFHAINIIVTIATLVKLMMVTMAILVLLRVDISISWYFVAVVVCLLESSLSFSLRKKLKMISVEQSIYYKRDALYDAFAGLQARRTFVARSRLFTNIFLSLITIIVIIITIVLDGASSIKLYLTVFCSAILLCLLAFDAIYALRLFSLNHVFVHQYKKEINKLFWKFTLEEIGDLSENEPSKKKSSFSFLSKQPRTFYGLKNFHFHDINEFSIALKKILAKRHIFISPFVLRQLLFTCIECGCSSGISTKLFGIYCKNCGRYWSNFNFSEIYHNSKSENVTSIIDWFDWQHVFIESLIQEGKYHFTSGAVLYFISPQGKKVLLGDGTLVQNEENFSFLSDDGIRLDFNISQFKGIPFKLSEGLYFNDTKLDYIVALNNKADALKVNMAVDSYRKMQLSDNICET